MVEMNVNPNIVKIEIILKVKMDLTPHPFNGQETQGRARAPGDG